MAEYIDRGALIEWLKRIRLIDLSDGRGLCRVIMEDDFKKAIKKMPKGIIADVAPVVRCKDCKHYLIADEFEGGKRYMCEVNHFSYINSDGDMRYCSYGERKDDKHEH